MIELKELQLKNYACHRDLRIKFETGMTGITGDNGSGKSSILSAIRFLFTGEVDTPSKQSAILLGETEGWVTGSLLINGKEAYLERHLSTSKVVLKYSGTVYNKASEVKDQWSRLLNIDTSIFNNVIMARQGEIPMLFNGDPSTREKVFQRIFLVPATEKLRSTIWDGYIKTAPPEKFEEDVSVLESAAVEIQARLSDMTRKQAQVSLELLPEDTLKSIITRLNFLGKCQQNLLARPALEKSMAEHRARSLELGSLASSLEGQLKVLDVVKLRRGYNDLMSGKQLAQRKSQLESELSSVMLSCPSQEDMDKSVAELSQAVASELADRNNLAALREALSSSQAAFQAVQQLDGHAECPTCKQTIPPEFDVQPLKKRYELAVNMHTAAVARLALSCKKAAKLKADNSLLNGQFQRVEELVRQLSQYGESNYSEEKLLDFSTQIHRHEQLSKQLAETKSSLASSESLLAVLSERLNGFDSYDGDSSPETEIAAFNEALEGNSAKAAEVTGLKVEQARAEQELHGIRQRTATSVENRKYNEKRRKYTGQLEKAYDILHVSKFPRKLIESYSEHVQSYLSMYLERFNIPYRARIAEGFSIKMLNSDGLELPKVSGGQEMIVGICLRLALHRMFAQSFPMWIVDEATAGMDKYNRDIYFALMDDIRKERMINQIIVIDHDPQLASVVDRNIELCSNSTFWEWLQGYS